MTTGQYPGPDERGRGEGMPPEQIHYTYGYRPADAPPPRRRNPAWTVLAAVGGLLVLAGIGVAIGLLFFADKDATPASTARPPATSDATGGPTAPATAVPSTPGDGEPTATQTPDDGRVAAGEMQVGTCFVDPYEDATQMPDGSYVIAGYEVVPCDQAHYGEVFQQSLSSASSYDADALVIEAEDLCYAGFADYVGAAYEDSALYIDAYTPPSDEWEKGSRAITCAVTDPSGSTTGSVRGSGR